MLIIGCKEETQKYDVVVYGGTPAGVIAAYAAASNGMKVLLIEQTNHIGGMNTSGLTTAESEHMIDKAITGFARDFYVRMGYEFPEGYFETFGLGRKLDFKRGDPAFFFESHVAEKVFLEMLKEKNVNIKYNLYVTDVRKKNKEIAEICLNDTLTIPGDIFIDCTYEGDLMARSSVSYTYGRESIDAYNESLAGIRLIDDTLNAKTVDDKGNLLPYFARPDSLIPGAADKRVITYNFWPTMTRAEENKVPVTRPNNYDSTRYNLLADYLAKIVLICVFHQKRPDQ